MAAYLRPRRGTASGSTVVLKEGEIFLDTAKSGNATTLSSWGQIYVGNNTNNISALKPFVSLPESMVVNSGISSTGSDSDIANGKNLATMFSAIKKLLSDHATSITNLNNDRIWFSMINWGTADVIVSASTEIPTAGYAFTPTHSGICQISFVFGNGNTSFQAAIVSAGVPSMYYSVLIPYTSGIAYNQSGHWLPVVKGTKYTIVKSSTLANGQIRSIYNFPFKTTS